MGKITESQLSETLLEKIIAGGGSTTAASSADFLNHISEASTNAHKIENITGLRAAIDGKASTSGTPHNYFKFNNASAYRSEILKNANDSVDYGTYIIDRRTDGAYARIIVNASSNDIVYQNINETGGLVKESVVYDTTNLSAQSVTPSSNLAEGYQVQVYS